MERKQNDDFVSISTRNIPNASNTHPHQKAIYIFLETPYVDLRAGPTRKVIRRTSRLCNPQNTHAPPRRDRGCQNTCLYIPLTYVSVLSHEHLRMALSELGKIIMERTRRIIQAWAALSYYTDQLMTPCSKYSSGGSTLNGTPRGDRSARVLCGQIGWLSEPLHGVDADCSGCTNLKKQTHAKNTEKEPPPPKHNMKATATRRLRPTRDGMRGNTFYALAHTLPLP